MRIELHAVAASGDEAFVVCAGRWNRLYRPSGRPSGSWCLEDLGEREPAELRRLGVARLRKDFDSFAALVAALEAPPEAEELPAGGGKVLRPAAGFGRRKTDAWSNEMALLVRLVHGRLDALFARHGFAAEEALPLILETFRRAYVLGPCSPHAAEDLFFQLALDLIREKLGEDTWKPPARRGGGPRPGAMPSARDAALEGLEMLTLRCLALASEPLPPAALSGVPRAARLLGLREDQVENRLQWASERVGCSRARLLTPAMHAACKRELDRRRD